MTLRYVRITAPDGYFRDLSWYVAHGCDPECVLVERGEVIGVDDNEFPEAIEFGVETTEDAWRGKPA